MAPLVAIITRTKHRPTLLNRCAESVLAQSFQDWVHVIVNDGGDESDLIDLKNRFSDRYRSRLVLCNHPTRLGMEAASNTGIRASESKYVTFLDDDDTWHHDFLSEMVRAIDESRMNKIKGAVCQTEIVEEIVVGDDVKEVNRRPFNPSLTHIQLEHLLADNRFTNNSFVYDRSALDTIGNYNESLEVLGDWDFTIRFFLCFDAVVVNRILARWHRRNDPTLARGTSFDQEPGNRHTAWRVHLINEAIRGNWLQGPKYLPLLLVLGARFDENNVHLASLSAGLDVLNSGISSVAEGVNSVNTGVGQLNASLGTSVGQLNTNLGAGLDVLNSGISSVSAGINSFNTGLDQLNANLGAGLDVLNSGISSVTAGVNSVNISLGQLHASLGANFEELKQQNAQILQRIHEDSVLVQLRRVLSLDRIKRAIRGG